jgi:hypothetical protein
VGNGKTHYMGSKRMGENRWAVFSVGSESVLVGEYYLDGEFWKINSDYAFAEELDREFLWSGDAFKLLWQISLRNGFSEERESR